MTTTSASLLLQLRDHSDWTAWNRFVEIYTPLIFYWARHAGLQSSDASDLVQEILTVVSQKISTFEYDNQQSFRGWLRKVAINQMRLFWRRRKRMEQLATESLLAGLPDVKSLESSWELSYRGELVAQAMAGMKPDFAPKTWEALTEWLPGHETAEAVAKRHNVSTWTLYAAKSRMLKRLRDELDGLLD
jgi:RNA polymerase sigma-70 factor (ECF subfamily)